MKDGAKKGKTTPARPRVLDHSLRLNKLADHLPPGAPEVLRAALENMDELTIAALNHTRTFKGIEYSEPSFAAAIKAQETSFRLFRMLGPEAVIDKPDEFTPQQVEEAKEVLRRRGWLPARGKKTNGDDQK